MGLWSGPNSFGYDWLILNANGSPKRIVRDMPNRAQRVIDAKSGEAIEQINDGHRNLNMSFGVLGMKEFA
jgi:hypothetical protein